MSTISVLCPLVLSAYQKLQHCIVVQELRQPHAAIALPATGSAAKRPRLPLTVSQALTPHTRTPLSGTLRELYSTDRHAQAYPEVMQILAERGSRAKAWEAQTAEFETEKQELQQKLGDAERQVRSAQADVARAAEHVASVRAQAALEVQAHEGAILREVERNVELVTDLTIAQAAQVGLPLLESPPVNSREPILSLLVHLLK